MVTSTMAKILYLSLFALILVPLDSMANTVAASCERFIDHSCDYYLCKEEQFRCGKNGYPLKFGYPNCKKYVHAHKDFKQRAQLFLSTVRICLQEELESAKAKNCKALNRVSYDSHVQCYVESGFCELPFGQKMKIASIVRKDIFLVTSIRTANEINFACTLRLGN